MGSLGGPNIVTKVTVRIGSGHTEGHRRPRKEKGFEEFSASGRKHPRSTGGPRN